MGRRLANARLVAQLQRETRDLFYGDTATIDQNVVDTLGDFGQPNVTTTSTSVSCSFTDKPKHEKWVGYADISQLAAEIRYEGAPVPAKGNKVTLTGRFGDTGYADKEFEIIGIRDRGTMGYSVALMVREL